MNWWSIIKNQIASTKGKQFQLDFNQPMIEEEDNCKERLINILNKLETFLLNKKGSSKVLLLQVSKPGNLEDISNEDCCKILDILGANGSDAKIKIIKEATVSSGGEKHASAQYDFQTAYVEKYAYFEKDRVYDFLNIHARKGDNYGLQYEHSVKMKADSPERQKLLDEIFDYGIYRIYDEG
tara:strand:- start:350 stop:895 length:546 start_codon:yes stop_codon:yes gene_type:complete